MLRRRANDTLSYQCEVDKGKLTAVASFKKADVSSVSSSLEQIGGLWVLCVLIYWGMELCYWWNHSNIYLR